MKPNYSTTMSTKETEDEQEAEVKLHPSYR